jgi:hypothetical protein
MIPREKNPIRVEINKERLREIVDESLRMLHEYLGGKFVSTDEQIKESLERILASDMITTQFVLELGSEKIPDMVLRVDPVRKEVLCKSTFRKKVAKINQFLRIL